MTFDPLLHYTLVWGSFNKIWWPSREFLMNLTSGWPWLTPAWPLTPAMCYTLIRPLVDPSWPQYDLWPQQCVTLWSGVLPTKFGGHTAFLSNLTSGWLWLTPAWPVTPTMHYALVRGSSQQIWWPQGIAKQIDPLLDPSWSLYDLWPQQCITLWSGVLPTKFGGQRVLLNKLTPTWPQLTPTWPLVRGSCHQIW